MSTDKNKQNLRYQKVSSSINKKVRYDGFSAEEVKYLKAINEKKQADKDLNLFWATAPRIEGRNVDWNSMSETEIDFFDYINKKVEKLSKKISRLEDLGIDAEQVIEMFTQLNCHSASY